MKVDNTSSAFGRFWQGLIGGARDGAVGGVGPDGMDKRERFDDGTLEQAPEKASRAGRTASEWTGYVGGQEKRKEVLGKVGWGVVIGLGALTAVSMVASFGITVIPTMLIGGAISTLFFGSIASSAMEHFGGMVRGPFGGVLGGFAGAIGGVNNALGKKGAWADPPPEPEKPPMQQVVVQSNAYDVQQTDPIAAAKQANRDMDNALIRSGHNPYASGGYGGFVDRLEAERAQTRELVGSNRGK